MSPATVEPTGVSLLDEPVEAAGVPEVRYTDDWRKWDDAIEAWDHLLERR